MFRFIYYVYRFTKNTNISLFFIIILLYVIKSLNLTGVNTKLE